MIHKAAMYGNLDELEQLIAKKGQDPCKFAEVGVLPHCIAIGDHKMRLCCSMVINPFMLQPLLVNWVSYKH